MIARLAAIVLVTGCTTIGSEPLFPETVIPDAAVDAIPLAPTFESLRENVFQPRCAAACHGVVQPAGSMDLAVDPYDELVNVPAMGPQCGGTEWIRVVPGDPDGSLLYQKVLAKTRGLDAPCGDAMPQGSREAPLSGADVDAIHDWIAAGAPMN